MNITKDIINDLIPIYAANECSADTRALVEEYLRQHPREGAELRRIMNTPIPKNTPSALELDEMKALRLARRRVRNRAWLIGLAIFFSLAPFSVIKGPDRAGWLFIDSPKSALAYGCVGIAFWIAYFVSRHRSKAL